MAIGSGQGAHHQFREVMGRPPGSQVRVLRTGVPGLGSDQGQSVVLGEVSEVLDVQGCQRQSVGKAAGGDPGVVDWPGPSTLGGTGGQLAPDHGDAPGAGDDGLVGEPGLEHAAVARSPAAQLRPLRQFADGHEREQGLPPGHLRGEPGREQALERARGDVGVQDNRLRGRLRQRRRDGPG